MGGDKKVDTTTPPINAKSSDEEKYIKYAPNAYNYCSLRSKETRPNTPFRDFLANIEAEEKKAKAAAH